MKLTRALESHLEEILLVLRIASKPDHEHRGGVASRGRTNAAEVLSFLGSSPGQAYTSKEIHEATGLPRASVGVVLSRLENRGFGGEYWSVATDEAVDETLDSMRTAQTVSHRFELEAPDE